MTYTGFRVTGNRAVTTRPADREQAVPGNTWARDRSAPGANDGTEIDATYLNRVRANLEGLVTALGGNLADGDAQLSNAAIALLASIAVKAPLAGAQFTGNLSIAKQSPQFDLIDPDNPLEGMRLSVVNAASYIQAGNGDEGLTFSGLGGVALPNMYRYDGAASRRLLDSLDLDTINDRVANQVYVKPSGGDDTANLQAALDSSASTIILRDAAEYTSGPLTVSTLARPKRIESNGARISFSGANDAIMIDASGSETTIGTLSADVAAGATVLPMTATAGITARQWIMLISATADTWGTGCKVGEMTRVLSVDSGTQVTLETPLEYAYLAAAPTTIKALAGYPLHVRGLRAVGSGAGASGLQSAIIARYMPVLIENVVFDRFDYAGIRLYRVPGAVVDKPRVSTAYATGLAYGVSVDRGSRDVIVCNGEFTALRHGVTAGGSEGVNINIRAYANRCIAMRDAGLDSHPAGDRIDFSHNTVIFGSDASAGSMDGIIGQGPRFKAAHNTVLGARRYGVIHQISAGQPHIVPVTEIDKNWITGIAGPASTRAAVCVTPSVGGTQPCLVFVRGNAGLGAAFTIGIYIDTSFISHDWVELTGNVLTGASSKGALIVADTGYTINGGVVARNWLGGGSTEAIYLQGTDADSIKDVLVEGNRSAGGTAALRLLNCLRVRFGQMIGTHKSLTTSGLNDCTALGGGSYTVAELTTTLAGQMLGATVKCSNARKNGEGAGVGTGLPAISTGTNWKCLDTTGLFVTPVA